MGKFCGNCQRYKIRNNVKYRKREIELNVTNKKRPNHAHVRPTKILWTGALIEAWKCNFRPCQKIITDQQTDMSIHMNVAIQKKKRKESLIFTNVVHPLLHPVHSLNTNLLPLHYWITCWGAAVMNDINCREVL